MGDVAYGKDDEVRLLAILASGCFEDHVPRMLQVLGLVRANLAQLHQRKGEWLQSWCLA